MSEPLSLWQRPGFPNLSVKVGDLTRNLVEAHSAEGVLRGQWSALSAAARQRQIVNVSTFEAISSASIRDRLIPEADVRSNSYKGSVHESRIDAVIASLNDAFVNRDLPVTHDQLCRWHQVGTDTDESSDQPNGYRKAEIRIKRVGKKGGDLEAPTRKAAPPSDEVPQKVDELLMWFNTGTVSDLLIRAAMFVLLWHCIVPFDSRNWQVSAIWLRLILSRQLGVICQALPLVSLIHSRRDQLFLQLRHAHRGTLDQSYWICWFLRQYRDACRLASDSLTRPLKAGRFWSTYSSAELKSQQQMIINYLLDQDDHGHSPTIDRKACLQKLGGMSPATASRHLRSLVDLGILIRAGLASDTRYVLNFELKEGADCDNQGQTYSGQ